MMIHKIETILEARNEDRIFTRLEFTSDVWRGRLIAEIVGG